MVLGRVYLALGEFRALETALYSSVVTATTLGYGELVLSERWRLLSTFEAMGGLMHLLAHLRARRRGLPQRVEPLKRSTTTRRPRMRRRWRETAARTASSPSQYPNRSLRT